MRIAKEITLRTFVVESIRAIDEQDAIEFVRRQLRIAGQSNDWRVYYAQQIDRRRFFNVLAEYRHTLHTL